MHVADQNQKFDALDGLTDGQREYLIAERRVCLTSARFDLGQALSAGLPESGEYSGHVIARTFEEADRVCRERGWGETVDGWVEAIKPEDDFDGGGLRPEVN